MDVGSDRMKASEGDEICALCCCRHNNRRRERVNVLFSDFLQNIENGATPGDEDGRWLCSNCSLMTFSAVESKLELDKAERDVRRRQLELLTELRKLQCHVKQFQRIMEEMNQVVLDSDSGVLTDRLGGGNEERMQFRSRILKVFCDLKTFSDGITTSSVDNTRIKTEVDSNSDIDEEEASGNDHDFPIASDNYGDNSLPPWPLENKSEPSDVDSVTDRLHSEERSDNDRDYEPQEEDDDDYQSDADYVPEEEKPQKSQTFNDGFGRSRGPRNHNSAAKRKHIEDSKRPCNCDICGKPFESAKYLKIHRLTHMNEQERAAHLPHKCSTCSKSFSSLTRFRIHKQTHLPVEQRSRKLCPSCGKSFPSWGGLKIHEKICGIPEEKKRARKTHGCHLCSKSFSTWGRLRTHLRDGHNTRKFQCSTCSKMYLTAQSLKEHVETVHANIRSFPCTKNCGKILKSNRSLKRHLTLCDGSGLRRKLECPVCSKEIRRQSSLDRHIKAKHGVGSSDVKEKKMLLCSHCPKTFKNKSMLDYHLSAVAGERRIICRKGCGAGFNFPSSRSRHEGSCSGSGTAHGRRPVYVPPRQGMTSEGYESSEGQQCRIKN